jgi:RimJ/RimL family protein N-acetyltransferase
MDAPAIPIHVPTLHTERLALVPPDHRCDDAYQRFYTDAEASAAYGGPLTPAAAWARLAFDVGAWALQGFGVWALQMRHDQAIVGVCGYWQGRGWPRELTWWLLPQHRGRGLALEASRAAIEHAYGTWGWPAVETYTNDHNLPARALVDRLGGVRIDRRLFPDGDERHVYRLPRRTGAPTGSPA